MAVAPSDFQMADLCVPSDAKEQVQYTLCCCVQEMTANSTKCVNFQLQRKDTPYLSRRGGVGPDSSTRVRSEGSIIDS